MMGTKNNKNSFNISILKISFFLCLIFLFFNCKNKEKFNYNKEHLQDSLAFELSQIYGLDQGIRHPKINAYKLSRKLVQKIDSLNFNRIIAFVKTNGMPTKKLLGVHNFNNESVEASFLAVLLHNPHRLVNEKEYLNIFIEEIKKGNLKKEFLALILDKYYWVKRDKDGNRMLLYGSSFGKPCLKYRKKSDSARAVIGLKPLADSLFINCSNK